jgi:hypothetical protein
MLEDENRYKLFYNNSAIYSPLIRDVNNNIDVMNKTVEAQTQTDIPFEQIGAAAGAAFGLATYVWTYPIVWVDGPLPIVDALWFGGLAFNTAKWSNWGRSFGKKLDIIEEVLL